MIDRGRSIASLTRQQGFPRVGAALVETAIVLPVTFFLILGLVVGVLGVFRYQEVASLTRAAGRYASTHGAQYRKDAGLAKGAAADWQADIHANAIAPARILLDPDLLTFQASWPEVVNLPGHPDNWPKSHVTITITYQWVPELYLVGPLYLSSTSCVEISH